MLLRWKIVGSGVEDVSRGENGRMTTFSVTAVIT